MLLLLTAHWSTARPSSLVTRSAIRSLVSGVVAPCRSLLASAVLKAAIAWPVARRWASRLSVPWVASFPSSARDIRRSFCSARTRASVGRATSVWYELERRTRMLSPSVTETAKPQSAISAISGTTSSRRILALIDCRRVAVRPLKDDTPVNNSRLPEVDLSTEWTEPTLTSPVSYDTDHMCPPLLRSRYLRPQPSLSRGVYP